MISSFSKMTLIALIKIDNFMIFYLCSFFDNNDYF